MKYFKYLKTYEGVKDNINLSEYNDFISDIFNKFKIIEKEFNSYTLDQLIDSSLYLILEKSTELETIFRSKYDEFDKIYENIDFEKLDTGRVDEYDEVENRFYKLNDLIEDFVAELEELNEAFQKIGDTHKGTNYFQKIDI